MPNRFSGAQNKQRLQALSLFESIATMALIGASFTSEKGSSPVQDLLGQLGAVVELEAKHARP